LYDITGKIIDKAMKEQEKNKEMRKKIVMMKNKKKTMKGLG
jgi:hypothetical protein